MDSDFSPPTPSPLYFKVLLKETRERAKICDALSVFLEEYAMLEEGLGKGLIKVIYIYSIHVYTLCDCYEDTIIFYLNFY